MNQHNVTTTRGPWFVSSCIETGILSVSRLREGSECKDGKTRFQNGQLDGKFFANDAELNQACITYGYTKKYGRNTCAFVMSRAARRRGYKTNDGMYCRAEKRQGK